MTLLIKLMTSSEGIDLSVFEQLDDLIPPQDIASSVPGQQELQQNPPLPDDNHPSHQDCGTSTHHISVSGRNEYSPGNVAGNLQEVPLPLDAINPSGFEYQLPDDLIDQINEFISSEEIDLSVF